MHSFDKSPLDAHLPVSGVAPATSGAPTASPSTSMNSLLESPSAAAVPVSCVAPSSDAAQPASAAAGQPLSVDTPATVPSPIPVLSASSTPLSATDVESALESALASMAAPPAGDVSAPWASPSFDLLLAAGAPSPEVPAADVAAVADAAAVANDARQWRDTADRDCGSDDDDDIPLVVNRARTDAEAVLFGDDPEEEAAAEEEAAVAASRAILRSRPSAALSTEVLEVLARESDGYSYPAVGRDAATPFRQGSYPRRRRPSLLSIGGELPAWQSNMSMGMMTPLSAAPGVDSLVRVDSGPLLSRDPSREQLTTPHWLAGGGASGYGLGFGSAAASTASLGGIASGLGVGGRITSSDREMSFDFFRSRSSRQGGGVAGAGVAAGAGVVGSGASGVLSSHNSNLRTRDMSDDQGLSTLMRHTSIEEDLTSPALPRGMSVDGELLAPPSSAGLGGGSGGGGGFGIVSREMSMEWPTSARIGGYLGSPEAVEPQALASDAANGGC